MEDLPIFTDSDNNSRYNRVHNHSHIKNIGVDDDGNVLNDISSGLIGQLKAREAASIIIDLIKSNKFAGKAILITGPSGTGKTALAYAISKSLSSRIPFCSISATEVYSTEVKKTEILTEYFRRVIGVRIKETKHIYEGEVVEIEPQETLNPHGKAAKVLDAVSLKLKTTAGSTVVKLSPDVFKNILKEGIKVRDVIYIHANTSLVKRLGVCEAYASQVDLEIGQYVPLPHGPPFKTNETVHDVTMHDLDVFNSKFEDKSDLSQLIAEHIVPKKCEISDRLRREVDKTVYEYVKENLAEITPGLIFIDECHLLDLECFAFLTRMIESENSPTLIMATNKGYSKIFESENPVVKDDIFSIYGIPLDFMDRMLIIKTNPIVLDEAVKIVKLRAEIERIVITVDAVRKIAEIGASTSMRFALQLLSPSEIIAKLKNKTTVDEEEVIEASTLFLDPRKSVERLMKKD